MSLIKIVTGDALPDLRFAFTDEDTELPVDLTDVTACLLRLRLLGSTTIVLTLSGMPDAPASAGYVRYVWPIGALDNVAAGMYEGEHELNHAGGRTISVFRPEKFKIRSQFG
jgi:hypothetical protein